MDLILLTNAATLLFWWIPGWETGSFLFSSFHPKSHQTIFSSPLEYPSPNHQPSTTVLDWCVGRNVSLRLLTSFPLGIMLIQVLHATQTSAFMEVWGGLFNEQWFSEKVIDCCCDEVLFCFLTWQREHWHLCQKILLFNKEDWSHFWNCLFHPVSVSNRPSRTDVVFKGEEEEEFTLKKK